MSYFRIHIIKIVVLFLFCAGTLTIVWPDQNRAQPGESVSNWLFDLRSDTENPVVHDKISSLRNEQGDIPGLLRKASGIVSEHSDDFTIPVDPAGTSDEDIYNTLLLKWTMHQQTAGVDTVMVTERKSPAPHTQENNNKTTLSQLVNSVRYIVGAYSRISDAWDYIRMILRPMAGGIAIGAP